MFAISCQLFIDNEAFIEEPLCHQMRRNMGIMIPINENNFYFETKQEKIQMKKIFFLLFIIVIIMISFLVYDNKIHQLDLKNHKTVKLMNQILEFRLALRFDCLAITSVSARK